MAENLGVCGYYRMSPLFSFLVLFPRCLPSLARFAFVSCQNAMPKPLFSNSNHSLTALWMDRWGRSPASWKENGISPHADVFYENGDAKQPPLHIGKIKTESLGGIRRFFPLQGKKDVPSNLSFSQLEHCLSLHFACRAVEKLEMSQVWGLMEEMSACEVSLALWGLEVGAVASATPVCG